MYKEDDDGNELRVERMWSGGGVSLNGSHMHNTSKRQHA